MLIPLVVVVLFALTTLFSTTPLTVHATEPTSQHTNNWAVIVSTSKYWFNYRHNSDALSIYHLIKKQGIPDSNIILMIPEDVACSPKNVIPATVYNTDNIYTRLNKNEYNTHNYLLKDHPEDGNLYNEEHIEVDYKGDDVTVENFLRILTGRHLPHTPRNKQLLSNAQSNLFVYLSGHGGDNFLKFRDTEILTAQDLSYAIHQAYLQQRFHQAFLIVETCQAATMVETIITPNVITSASSERGENSYSHGQDPTIGASIVDKFTYYLHQFYDQTNHFKTTTIGQFLRMFNYRQLHSNHIYRTELYEYDQVTGKKIRSVDQHKILDFFGASHDYVEATAVSTAHPHHVDLAKVYRLNQHYQNKVRQQQQQQQPEFTTTKPQRDQIITTSYRMSSVEYFRHVLHMVLQQFTHHAIAIPTLCALVGSWLVVQFFNILSIDPADVMQKT